MYLTKSHPRSLANFFLDDAFAREFFVPSTRSGRTHMPSANIIETEKGFEIELAAPGYSKADFQLKIENKHLVISTEKKEVTEQKEKNYTRKEFHFDAFKRSFSLPQNVEESAIEASYENGILNVVLPKKNVDNTQLIKTLEVK